MSRLEEIKEKHNNKLSGIANIPFGQKDKPPFEIVLKEDFDWLISRVEELEEEIYQDNRQAVLEGLYEENQRYKDLLTDFANAGENIDDLYYYQEKARRALKGDTP